LATRTNLEVLMRDAANLNMRHGFGFVQLIAILILISAGVANAATVQETINFKGGLHNQLTGACGSTTYNSICPSGSCRCEQYEGMVVTGNLIGKVTHPESNYPAVGIDITVDSGTDSVGSVNGRCEPIFASLFVVGSKDTQELDFNGSYCTPLGNPNAANAQSPIKGGFGIESSTVGYTGFGTVSGSVGFNSGSIKLLYKGPATH
jgi:hypothetical protein